MNTSQPNDPVRVPVITPARDFTKPSSKQQSWGALISIIVIVLMVVTGAFYAYQKRIAGMSAVPDAKTSIPE